MPIPAIHPKSEESDMDNACASFPFDLLIKQNTVIRRYD